MRTRPAAIVEYSYRVAPIFTTAGGTSEIQKNLIAERDPRPPARPLTDSLAAAHTDCCDSVHRIVEEGGGDAGAVVVGAAEHGLGGLDPPVPAVDGLVGVDAFAAVELVRGCAARGGTASITNALACDAASTDVAATVDFAGRVVDRVACGHDVDEHVGTTVLHGLERADRRAPLRSCAFTRSTV